MRIVIIATACAMWVLLTVASDLCMRSGIGKFNHGINGAPELALASRLNPLSMNVRLLQMETLFKSWQVDRNLEDLKEAALIAESLVHDFPGNAQVKAAQATAVGILAAHGGGGVADAWVAIQADPTSLSMIEQQMFNLAVTRRDRPQFIGLGIKRAALTNKPLVMLCPLCGKGWLEHDYPSR